MKNQESISRFALATLCLTVFIDAVGAALILPILGPLFVNDGPNNLLPWGDQIWRSVFYGLSLGLFSLGMFVAAPILGSLSDQKGRKPVLLVCLSGSLVGYLSSAAALHIGSVWLFLVGRTLDGITAGSLSVSVAAILDTSGADDRPKKIGQLMFFVSVGHILGPLLGGVLSDSGLSRYLGLTVPLYFAAALSFIAVVSLWFGFRDSLVPAPSNRLDLFAGLRSLYTAFADPQLRTVAIPLFLMQFGWATYFQFLGIFLTRRYGFEQDSVAYYLTLLGFGFAVTFGTLVGPLTQRFELGKVTLTAMSAMAVAVGLVASSGSPVLAWALALPSAIAYGLGFSGLMALLTSQVEPARQGMISGVVGAICAFCAGSSGLVAGNLAGLNSSLPLWAASVIIAVGVVTCRLDKTSLDGTAGKAEA